MSSSPHLPSEIFDCIVDYLHAERNTLKACCVVSKSWVPRARIHLFARVTFHPKYGPLLGWWARRFPDPSASPAYYTRSLWFCGFPTSSDVNRMLVHIRSFCNIVELEVETTNQHDSHVSLVPLHGVSPTLKFLSLRYVVLKFSEILNLICSFPLLEDLTLIHRDNSGALEEYDIPSTSPKLTGTLTLDNKYFSMTRALTSLPNGLRFSKIVVLQPVHHAESTLELLSKCSDTLETLSMRYSDWSAFHHFLCSIVTLPLSMTRTDRSAVPPAFDLSKYSKLQDLQFHTGSASIRWIIMTLEAAKPGNLQRITIYAHKMPSDETGEEAQEWRDLDCLLSTLWTLHSISPAVTCNYDLKARARRLLPELINDGVVSYSWLTE